MGMMRGIRKNIKGIYWIVVVMVTVSFILWGTRIGGGGGPKYAGAVFGKKVSMKEFRRQWLAARERAIQYQHMTGRVIPADLIEALTWERIVKLREAERLGVVVTTREVKDRISNMFSTDEGFNETVYRRYLESRRLSEQEYADIVRDNVRIAGLELLVNSAVLVSPQELREKYDYEQQQRKIRFHMVEVDSLLPAFEVSGEGEQYYRSHKDEFREPKKVAVEYAMVEKEPFLEKVSLAEEELKSYYEENKSSYKGADGKTAEFGEVKPQIERILKARKADEMARQHAEEVFNFSDASKMREVAQKNNLPFGETGLIPEKGPVTDELAKEPRFRAAAFGTPLGEVSPIIEAEGGYCVLGPTRVVPGRIPPFDEVRNEAAEKQRVLRLKAAARHAGVPPDKIDAFVKEHSVIPADVGVTHEDVQRYYDSPSHKSEFMKQKKVKVQYLVVEKEPFEKEVRIRERDIKREYRDNESKYKDDNDKVKPLAEVREEIEKDLMAKEADKMASERADDVFSYRPQTMRRQALRYGLELRESRLFAQGEMIDDYIGNSAIFAYRALQTKLGDVSATFPIDKGYCVLSPIQVVEAAGADLEDVVEEASEKAVMNKAENFASKIAYELYLQVREKMTREKKDFETVTTELGLKTEESGYFRRDDLDIEKVGPTRGITRSIFQLEPDKIGPPRKVPRGTFLYTISEIKPPSDEEFAQDRKARYSKLANDRAREAFQEWSTALLREANIKKSLLLSRKKPAK